VNPGLLPLAVLVSSLVPGLIIFLLPEERIRLRTALNLLGALTKVVLVALLLAGVSAGRDYHLRHEVLHGLHLVLKADAMALLFVTLSTGLWFLTTLYAVGYLEGSPNRARFFGFFSLCVTATMGIAMAGNLFTFFVFYEVLTLVTYPLVVHRGTANAMRGGTYYLVYTLGGGAVLLAGIVWLQSLIGSAEFTAGGVVAGVEGVGASELRLVFLLLVLGVGVKAAIVPLHGWLPRAMVAPAPVSALLHAVAVVKAGAFGIVRLVYDVYGVEHAQSLGLLVPLALVAAVTILWGSVRALLQDDLKRRLAYSTVSQVSYIVLGVGLFGPTGTVGGLVHLVHQGLMKITLFFGAGNYAETLGIHRVSEMNGCGRRMPWTTVAFSVAALGMMGAPLTAGAVSKEWLGDGASDAGLPWAGWVLTASSLLNAAYFLPILHRAWLRPPRAAWPEEHIPARGRRETAWLLLVPPLVTAAATVLVAVLAETGFSPLSWARLIAAREYVGSGALPADLPAD
jgi:multicomponent Na+:H+ antiporter subunit D